MSELRPIGDFGKIYSRLEMGSYLAKQPPAVLMQDVTKATFRAVRSDRSDTVEMLIQADHDARESGETDLNAIPREVAYMVVSLGSTSNPDARRLLLGSSANCDIIIPDESVSREHAWIERSGEQYTIEDNNSRNGTWIGSDALLPGSPHPLAPGNLIAFGGTDLIFLDPAGFYHFVRQFLGV